MFFPRQPRNYLSYKSPKKAACTFQLAHPAQRFRFDSGTLQSIPAYSEPEKYDWISMRATADYWCDNDAEGFAQCCISDVSGEY